MTLASLPPRRSVRLSRRKVRRVSDSSFRRYYTPSARASARPPPVRTGRPCDTRTRRTGRSSRGRSDAARSRGVLPSGSHDCGHSFTPRLPSARSTSPGITAECCGIQYTTSAARAVRNASRPPGNGSSGRERVGDDARATSDGRLARLRRPDPRAVALDHRGGAPRVPEHGDEDVHRARRRASRRGRAPSRTAPCPRAGRAGRRARRRPPSRRRRSRRPGATPRGTRSSARGRARSRARPRRVTLDASAAGRTGDPPLVRTARAVSAYRRDE